MKGMSILTTGVLLVLVLACSVESLRFHSQRYGLSFEYDEREWNLEEHPNVAGEFSSAYTLRSIQQEGKQIILGHHQYHKSVKHDVRKYDELYRKANPTGVEVIIDHQEAFVINGLEAHFVAGESPITQFCNVHIAHGRIVWYVWTNVGYKPENSSLYADYFGVFMSIEFDENAPSILHHANIYGAAFNAPDFDENHPVFSNYNDYKVAFEDIPDPLNAEKKKSRKARDCNSQCMVGGGWFFGDIGTPTWCYCCNSNCGGHQGNGNCGRQGWPTVCNSGGGGGGAFSGWTSPIPGAWIWCGSYLHTGAANWAADVQAGLGTTVQALVSSSINFSGFQDNGYGNVVLLASGSYYAANCHLNSRSVTGGNVNQGQSVGTVGNTGCGSCAVHLHFHIRNGNYEAVNLNQLPKFSDPNRRWPTSGTASGGSDCARFN